LDKSVLFKASCSTALLMNACSPLSKLEAGALPAAVVPGSGVVGETANGKLQGK
jgi:hypothetical protein